jgi:hypothetical protein
MGAVITFPEVRRMAREVPPALPYDATVIILPVVRVERAAATPNNPQDESHEKLHHQSSNQSPHQSPNQSPKSPSGGKRRRRASRT